VALAVVVPVALVVAVLAALAVVVLVALVVAPVLAVLVLVGPVALVALVGDAALAAPAVVLAVPVVVPVAGPEVDRMVNVVHRVRSRVPVVVENSTSLSPNTPRIPRAMLRCQRAPSSSSVEFQPKSLLRS